MKNINRENMKVLLAIFSKNEEILHIEDALKELNCETKIFYTDSYECQCTYIMKKVNEIGLHNGRDDYYRKFYKRFTSTIRELAPDLILFVNIPAEAINIYQFRLLVDEYNIACWSVDSLKKQPNVIPYLKSLKYIYVFEEDDVAYLRDLGIEATYLPVGYSSVFQRKMMQKDIDILFIGSPFRHRLKLLEKIAKEGLDNNWIVRIIGPFFSTKYPWKEYFFKWKYPCIYYYLENKRISPKEAAEFYARTKICLNIHTVDSKSPNPRTFEILATESFELIDKRSYWGGLRPGKDLESYKGIDDLIKKIKLYLGDSARRKKIALTGYQHVHDKMSMKRILQRIIKNIQ